VTAHHGSLSKETRLNAEGRLKAGQLKALVATASLELGIDIGHVDLVCQIGSPHRIATLLQRVGRSGHTLTGTPKGRMLPVSRDDLIECAALLRAVGRGELDRVAASDAPLDVLAQQITAEASCRECAEGELFEFVRRAWPFRALARRDFDAVVAMLSNGFATRRGRRGALVHRDEVHSTLRGRRGSRLLALTSGGAIPEVANYRVILEPSDTFLGTLDEDFAIESSAGDIFQLGNASWQISQVVAGTVRVIDAHGAPPTIPFWLGEAPARSDELSRAVSDLRADADRLLSRDDLQRTTKHTEAQSSHDQSSLSLGASVVRDLVDWFESEIGLCRAGAEQAAAYLDEGRRTLGVIPTQDALVVERFFDESGGMQLVLHAPFGSRVNKAWALALRKRFCRQFNFELQAVATEEALMLSLGPQHSFPLADVFRYLHPASVRDILVQAMLDAPMFAARWRWNTTVSLAVPRNRAGRKVPPQLQRMHADDLMAAVFPDAAACLENIPGDREIPDHPLVNQAVRDCLEEAMDLAALQAVLERIHRGELRCVSRDTPEPSVFADEVVTARPYAFLDDAPLEERRAHAVQMRRPGNVSDETGALDASAIERVRDEERPDPRDADELHDALLTAGFLRAIDVDLPRSESGGVFEALAASARATRMTVPSSGGGTATDDFWVAAERLPELLAVHPGVVMDPPISAPASRAARTWTRESAIVELVRGRLTIAGPVTATDLARSLGITQDDADAALLALEGEGVVLRGVFTPGARRTGAIEWCDRRLLARIHRYTLNRLRAEIAPVSAADFMRFLFAWQHVDPTARLTGADGLRAVIAQLDGIELPARAWEREVLPARVERFESSALDMLCLTGAVGWARFSSGPTQVVGATPIALFLREHAEAWLSLASSYAGSGFSRTAHLHERARRLFDILSTRGASFGADLLSASQLPIDEYRAAVMQLVAAGVVTSDSFAGLRGLIQPPSQTTARRGHDGDAAGRWSTLRREGLDGSRQGAIEALAWTLLRRYGVVFRRLLAREASNVSWRELAQVYRVLEARGDIRGGRFVSGMSGEQFAMPDAVDRLREIRRSSPDDRLLTISAADPLNLTGIVTPGDRLRAAAGNRVVYRNGIPVAAMEGDMLRVLSEVDPAVAREAAAAAAGRRVPVISGYVGRLG
jgi:ATP-dependent Lhr-like helicase